MVQHCTHCRCFQYFSINIFACSLIMSVKALMLLLPRKQHYLLEQMISGSAILHRRKQSPDFETSATAPARVLHTAKHKLAHPHVSPDSGAASGALATRAADFCCRQNWFVVISGVCTSTKLTFGRSSNTSCKSDMCNNRETAPQ